MAVKQITQSQFDERFYTRDDFNNSSTGLPFFPSVTHVLDMLPTPPELVLWFKNYGHEASRIFRQSAVKGTFVHNKIEEFILEGELDLKNLQFNIELEQACPDPKEQAFSKRCLMGFMEWVVEMQSEHEDFEILETECPLFGSDYAGTVDLLVRMSGKLYIVDFKTSSQINEKHEVQVEAYRRAKGADYGGVLKLGNIRPNCKNFSFKVAKTKKKQEKLWEIFQCAKKLFYLTKKGSPTEENIPDGFKLPKKLIKNVNKVEAVTAKPKTRAKVRDNSKQVAKKSSKKK